ncbi:MAG: sulfotransferase [Candidatus Eremiobacteraeota bacterium]|nr:sulfotransferase [Candidatus Eremiobacteraeota bacterium]MCW5870330.1 sulfotransferase [Candidatus Eremiobacteraeota bacterium]
MKAGSAVTLQSLEHELLAMWREVLEIDELGSEEKFTDRGGTPERGGRLIEKLEQRFQLILHLPWLVAAPTVKDQAQWLLYRCFPGPPAEEPAQPQSWRDAFARRFPDLPEETPGPALGPVVFLLSAARTGSTLLRIMLAGHSRLFSPPELELLLFRDMQERRGGLMDGWSDFKGLERALMELRPCDQSAAGQEVARLLEENASTYQIYGQLQQLCAPRLLVDKSPSYPLSRPALRRAERWFRQPRYIHLVRHPLPCIRSWTACNFDQVLYGPPRQAAEMDWLISNENILEHLGGIEARRHILVRYEDVLADAEAQARRICQFLELEYEEGLIHPYRGDRMTERLDGLVSGDKMFYKKSSIDASALQGARRLPEDGALTDETRQMAEGFGYGEL